MANRAYLLNTSFLTSDPGLLRSKLKDPGNDFVEIAEAAYRIPIPWLCCFRKVDLQRVTIDDLVSFDGSPTESIEVSLPSATVKQAMKNLQSALPIFEMIAGDAKIAREYWQDAMSALQEAPLPFLTIDATEVISMGDAEPYGKEIIEAVSGDASAIPSMKHLAGYEDGVVPYPLHVVRCVQTTNNPMRLANAVALDFGTTYFWHLSAGSNGPETTVVRPSTIQDKISLCSILDEVQTLVESRLNSAHAFFGFSPAGPSVVELLKMLISTETDEQRNALLADQLLKDELCSRINIALKKICHEYKFSWLGFIIESNETLTRKLNGNLNSWTSLPVTYPLTLELQPAESEPQKPVMEKTRSNVVENEIGTMTTRAPFIVRTPQDFCCNCGGTSGLATLNTPFFKKLIFSTTFEKENYIVLALPYWGRLRKRKKSYAKRVTRLAPAWFKAALHCGERKKCIER